MRRNASSASKGSHRRQRRRILKETALIYPKIIMVIIMQPHRWDKTLRWREVEDSNCRSLSRNGSVSPAERELRKREEGSLEAASISGGDRGFKSVFLQRGVWCEPDFQGRIP